MRLKYGVKVVDKSGTYNKKRLNKYINTYKSFTGCEMAQYNKSHDFIEGLNYNMFHTETNQLSIEKLLNNPYDLYDYISGNLLPILKQYNINNIVVHVMPGSVLDAYTDKELQSYVKFLASFSTANKINVFLENTYSDTKEMEKLFSFDIGNVLNFCFDIGHAKALSRNEGINSWIEFIKNFYGDTHVHYHANKGVEDEHLPITSTTNKWITDFHQGKDYYDIAKDIINVLKDKKNSSFILETHPSFIKKNKDFFNEIGITK